VSNRHLLRLSLDASPNRVVESIRACLRSEPLNLQTPTTTETAQTIDQLNHETELEQLQAQRKALTASIKEIKQQRKAARLHERDSELSNVVATRLAGRVKSHIKAGETQEQAIEAVFAQYRAAVVQRLSDTEGEQTCASCGGAIDLAGECVNACAGSRTAEVPSSAFAVES
jgi:hypothetical protein